MIRVFWSGTYFLLKKNFNLLCKHKWYTSGLPISNKTLSEIMFYCANLSLRKLGLPHQRLHQSHQSHTRKQRRREIKSQRRKKCQKCQVWCVQTRKTVTIVNFTPNFRDKRRIVIWTRVMTTGCHATCEMTTGCLTCIAKFYKKTWRLYLIVEIDYNINSLTRHQINSNKPPVAVGNYAASTPSGFVLNSSVFGMFCDFLVCRQTFVTTTARTIIDTWFIWRWLKSRFWTGITFINKTLCWRKEVLLLSQSIWSLNMLVLLKRSRISVPGMERNRRKWMNGGKKKRSQRSTQAMRNDPTLTPSPPNTLYQRCVLDHFPNVFIPRCSSLKNWIFAKLIS